MIFQLVEILASVLEFFFCMMVCGKFAQSRFSKPLQYLVTLILSIICAGVMIAINSISLFSIVASVLMAIFVGSLSLILYKNNHLFIYSVVFSYMVFLISLDFLVVSIIELWGNQIGFTLEMMTSEGYPRMYYIILMKFILVVSYCLFSIFVKPQKSRKISAKISILSFVFCTLFCLCVNYLINAIVIGDIVSIQQSVIIAWFSIVISVAFAILIVVQMNKSYEVQKQLQFVTIEQQMLEKSHKQLQFTYKQNLKNYHDFKNHISNIQTMLNNNQSDAASEYVNRLSDYYIDGYSVFTGSEMVDALLNNKVALAKNNNIPIEINSMCNIIEKEKSVDVCSVLANLIDNAIEASENEPKKQIIVDIKKVHEMLIITTKNKLSKDPFVNGKLISNKNDKDLHGIGLKSVRMTVEKYDGEQTQEYDNNWFVSSVMI